MPRVSAGRTPANRRLRTAWRAPALLVAVGLGIVTAGSPAGAQSSDRVIALSPGVAPGPGTPDQNHGLVGTRPYDAGLYVHDCPRTALSISPRAAAAGTSEAGWPPDQCLKMDKGPGGEKHTMVGLNGVHNWLLGGYGSDTIIGGNRGDVIWADYRPTGGPRFHTATIYAGNGHNVIYADDTRNYVWTGTNPHTVVHAHNAGTSGVIHCQSPGIVVYLSVVSQRDYTLHGCQHISHYSVGY